MVEECTKCDGRGFCLTCDGMGEVGNKVDLKECPDCSGNGNCSECDGLGYLKTGEMMAEDITPIIYKVACQYYHCSDGDDEQYPDCKEKHNRLVCPALKLIDIYEEIEREKIEAKEKEGEVKCQP